LKVLRLGGPASSHADFDPVTALSAWFLSDCELGSKPQIAFKGKAQPDEKAQHM